MIHQEPETPPNSQVVRRNKPHSQCQSSSIDTSHLHGYSCTSSLFTIFIRLIFHGVEVVESVGDADTEVEWCGEPTLHT